MKKEFYTDIRDRVLAQVPAIKTFGLFNDQFNNEDQEKAARFVKCYIEFLIPEYRSEGYGIQKADIEFILHIGFKQWRDDITILDTVQAVALALHGYNGEFFSSIDRLSETQDVNHDSVLVWQMGFRCTLTDDMANKWAKLNVKNPPIALEVIRDLDIDNDTIRTGDGVV